jgi:hypothetical protein
MSEELFKAVYTKFTTPVNAFYTATGGRLEFSKAPESWVDNFAVVQGAGSFGADTFRISIGDVFFQISVFSQTRAGCWSLMDKCRTLYHNAQLTVASHYPVLIRKDNEVFPLWNESSRLYQATIDFRCKLQKT